MKPTLKLIRDPWLLTEISNKQNSTFAAESSLLKWSQKNRKWLFENCNDRSERCGLCFYHRQCKFCPLKWCTKREDFKRARYAKDFETFNKAAESFYSWMGGKLKNDAQ